MAKKSSYLLRRPGKGLRNVFWTHGTSLCKVAAWNTRVKESVPSDFEEQLNKNMISYE